MTRFSLRIVLATTLGWTLAFGQFDNVGTSAATFLKIGIGPRGEALGGAYSASVKDVSSVFWNVAGLANMTQNEIMFTQTNWIADVEHFFVGIGLPMGDFGTLGASVTYLTMGEMKVTTWEKTEGTGEFFSAYDAVIGLSYARKLSDRFAIGVQLKYVTEYISRSSASAFAIDVGTQYQTGLPGLRLGMSLSNFGTAMRMEGQDMLVKFDPHPDAGSNPDRVPAYLETANWSLPLYFQFGVSYDIFSTETMRLTSSVDFRDERDYRSTVFVGGEFAFSDMVFLRGGLRPRTDGKISGKTTSIEQSYSFAGGVGAKVDIPGTYFKAAFDYSYSDLNRLKAVHRIGVSFLF